MIQLPEKPFYTLVDLEAQWFTSASDIHQWLVFGDLQAAAWLPVMSVVEQTADKILDGDLSKLCHWEGFIQLSGHQCRRLFRNGQIILREFVAFEGDHEYQLPEPVDDITVGLDDVVILEQERRRFEARYPRVTSTSCHSTASTPSLGFKKTAAKNFDPSYRSVYANGHQYYFGEMQARIILRLAEAAQQGKPWQSGKALLHDAGSQSYSLSNVFKRHPVWKELIQSDRRGFYRLNEAFLG